MNYIKALQTERDELKAQLGGVNEKLTDYVAYLQSDKFCGDGKNFVNSDEVSRFLLELRMETLT